MTLYVELLRAKSNVRQQNQMLFGGYFWAIMVPLPMKQ